MQDGTYEGRTIAGELYEAASGAMMAIITVDVGGERHKAWLTLVQKDGTVSERGIKNVQEIMGWQAWDWGAFDRPESFAGKACDVVLATEPDQKGEMRQRVKWLNPPGGGGLQAADPKAMAAKYGAKFRAICGGVAAPVKPAAAVQPQLPKRAVPMAAPLKPTGPTSTMEACWQKMCESNQGKPQQELEAAWFALVERLFPGKPQTDLGPADWGLLLCELDDPLRF